jgi:putative solute:sodium symporter small subunit
MDRKFVMMGYIYAILGLALGIHMAESHNHGQLVTHAHIMLLGFVVSFLYGITHNLWLNNITSALSKVQFYIHQLGTVVLIIGLFMGYGNFVSMETLDPLLAGGSIAVFIGLILMVVLFIQSRPSS